MGSMAEAVGPPIAKYNSRCFKPLLAMLGDKAALMRADVIATANKWSEETKHLKSDQGLYIDRGLSLGSTGHCHLWEPSHLKCAHFHHQDIFCILLKSSP